MSGIGNSTVQPIQTSEHDQNPYLVAADLIQAGYLNSSALPDGSEYSDYLFWNGSKWAVDTANQVHIGNNAGQTSQGANSVAIGNLAGKSTQGAGAVALGNQSGEVNQGANSVAIGNLAGQTSQTAGSIVLNASGAAQNTGQAGFFVNPIRNATNANAVLYNATTKELTYDTASSGGTTLPDGTKYSNYAFWNGSAWATETTDIVHVGVNAGQTNQGAGAVAIGSTAGSSNQSVVAVAIGNGAGQTSQGEGAVAIGSTAGSSNQNGDAVAIGNAAGQTSQGPNTVAVGALSGASSQGEGAVAIGSAAGDTSQGDFAVAIGFGAGAITAQGANTIILNASGTEFSATTSNRFYVNPVGEGVKVDNPLYYDKSTGEIYYVPAV